MRGRLAAYLSPLAWLALTAGFLGLATLTRQVAPEETAQDGPAPELALREALADLLDILWPDPPAPATPVDGSRLAAWMARLERRERSLPMDSLYDLVDRHYENLITTERRPAASPAGPGERWTRFLDDWRAWARRHDVFPSLELAVSELWLPGDPVDSVEILADDGRGAVAARWPEILRPDSATEVSGWTLHRFLSPRRGSTHPPLRQAMSVYFRVEGPDTSPRVLRLPLGTREDSGEGRIELLAPDTGAVAGLVRLRWNWAP